MKVQNDLIRDHLIKHGSISSMESFKEYGITRLSARIWDLRAMGYDIKSLPETDKNRYGRAVSYTRYVLENKNVSM